MSPGLQRRSRISPATRTPLLHPHQRFPTPRGNGQQRDLLRLKTSANGSSSTPGSLRRKTKPRHEDGAHGPTTLFFSVCLLLLLSIRSKRARHEGGQSGGGTRVKLPDGTCAANYCQPVSEQCERPALTEPTNTPKVCVRARPSSLPSSIPSACCESVLL